MTTVHSRWDFDGKGIMRKVAFHQSVAWGLSADREGWLDAMVLARAMCASRDQDGTDDREQSVLPMLLNAALA